MHNGLSRKLEKLKSGRPVVALTAADYPMGRLLDEAGVDLILVGDSLGMVELGLPDTTEVTMDIMLHHTRSVARGVTEALLVADLPFDTINTPEEALANAKQLIQAGAEGVKLEGGREIGPTVLRITAEHIPVIGHIGMLPQRIREEGRYRIKGKTEQEASSLLEDARTLQEAGACALVLELVEPSLAGKITDSLHIPTIGIGSGARCGGQILVTHDLVGLFPWFRPRFATPRADLAGEIQRAAREFIEDVRHPPQPE